MQKLSRKDLWSLEQYAEKRAAFRAEVMEHKKHRHVALGPNARLYFEDRKTIQYQVQEMLRVEKVFEIAGIEDELSAYNPLIPDGSNWKATFMLEYPDAEERRQRVTELKGVEKAVWVQVAGHERVRPIADEDLERETEEKTSTVHFLRFELTPEMVAAVNAGGPVTMGIDHPNYTFSSGPLESGVRDALAGDLEKL